MKYISRESALKLLRGQDGKFSDTEGKWWSIGLNAAISHIKELPAADVVPVVRCRECKHWQDWGACGHPDNGFDAPPMKADDFCSRGEKR